MFNQLKNQNLNKSIWLDLELREDIDDYITLIFALEQNLKLTEVSIHNPSEKEFYLLVNTLRKFNSKATPIITGKITEYSNNDDIHSSLYNIAKPLKSTVYSFKNIEDFSIIDFKDKIFFCGGSLTTLSKVLNRTEDKIFAYIQGGYAGEKVAGLNNTLDKFKGREKVSTWNLNLDIQASDKVLYSSNIDLNFISKNICHDSWCDIKNLNKENNEFNRTLKNYFLNNEKSRKCLHDFLAFLSIYIKGIVKFESVELFRTYEKIPKWHSEKNEFSNKKISKSFKKDMYLEIIEKYNKTN